MKKVLLATTALVATAGFAAAEISFSGTATVGAAKEGTADATLETGLDFNVALSGEADSGLTWSTSFDMGTGNMIDYNDDFAVETQRGLNQSTDADNNDAEVNSVETPTVSLGYQGYTIAFGNEEIDNAYDDDLDAHDVSVSGSAGGVDFTITSELDNDEDGISYSIGGTFSGVSVTLSGATEEATAADDDAAMELALAYSIGTATLEAEFGDNGAADDADYYSLGASYTMGAVTASYTATKPASANADLGDEWDLDLSYSAGPLTASFGTSEGEETEVQATYGLGGGVTAFVTIVDQDDNADDFAALGMAMTF